MNYPEILQKLEALRDGYKQMFTNERAVDYDDLYMLYGELEEVINRFAGIDRIEVESNQGGKKTYFSNYIAARLLSSRTFYTHEGYTQLLKIIGKVRQHQ